MKNVRIYCKLFADDFKFGCGPIQEGCDPHRAKRIDVLALLYMNDSVKFIDIVRQEIVKNLVQDPLTDYFFENEHEFVLRTLKDIPVDPSLSEKMLWAEHRAMERTQFHSRLMRDRQETDDLEAKVRALQEREIVLRQRRSDAQDKLASTESTLRVLEVRVAAQGVEIRDARDKLAPSKATLCATAISFVDKDEIAKDEDGEAVCVVCMTNKPCIIYSPCLHVHVCATCTVTLLDATSPECPSCREKIERIERVFLQ